MEETIDLVTLKESLKNVKEFYTLVEYRSWGVNYRVFKSRAGAVAEALHPGFESKDHIVGYPYRITGRVNID